MNPEAPWFLYLHYMDPHGAYAPPAEFLSDTVEPDHVRTDELPYNVPADCVRDGGFDAQCVREHYAGEVRYVDREIGRLLSALEQAGRLDETVVVFTSDHGESLGEHDYFFEHGKYAYEATCHVPLFVRGPGIRPGSCGSNVSLADLAPTLLQLCLNDGSSSAAARLRGRSLADELSGEADGPRSVFLEKIAGEELARSKQIKGVRIGDWKLLRNYTHLEARDDTRTEEERELRVLSEELYALADDPHETIDRSAAPPAEAPVAELRAELDRFQAAELEFSELARRLAREREALRRSDPEREAALRALGY